MKRIFAPALGGLLMLAAGQQAEAQGGMMGGPSRFDLGAYGGGSVSSRWYESSVGQGGAAANDGGNHYKIGFAPSFGGTATLWFTPTAGVRAHYGYIPSKVPFFSENFTDIFPDEPFDELPLNNHVYDLNLALRPFAMRGDLSGFMQSVYFYLGGGGWSANIQESPGDASGCEPVTLTRGACLDLEGRNATVIQLSFGTGATLIPFTPNFGIFGELGFHGYDSPVSTDNLVGVPAGVTAEDRYALTTRLDIGLKLGFGGGREEVIADVPAPVVAPPPPAPTPRAMTRVVEVCVIQNGQLQFVTAQLRTDSPGEITYGGQPLSQAFPASTGGYAAGANFFINRENVRFGNQTYVPFGATRTLQPTEVTRVGDFGGVTLFARPGAGATPAELFVLPRASSEGCEVQAFQRQETLRPRGE